MLKSKFTSIVLSVIIAFGLWLYVVTNVSQEAEYTIYNIPIVLEGETLLNEKNLMITDISADDVDLTLSGRRSDLAKVNSSNMILKANLGDISEPQEKKPLSYVPVYPSNVPSNALTIENRNPAYIFVTVEARRNKEVPVEIQWEGSAPEGYMSDRENRILDYSSITVVGPASVADQIEKAVITVDLSKQKESISQDFRYTLCDKDGNPVDAKLITTNVETVHLDVKIQQVKEVKLVVEIVYGGGATEKNTVVTVTPETIRLSGGEAVLAELGDMINLGRIDLRVIENSQAKPMPITLPEGVTNLSNITEAQVEIKFSGLSTRVVEVGNIVAENIPEGLEAEIIDQALQVTLRGPILDLQKIRAEDIVVHVDFADAGEGMTTLKAVVEVPQEFSTVGAIKAYFVNANIWREVCLGTDRSCEQNL